MNPGKMNRSHLLIDTSDSGLFGGKAGAVLKWD